MANKKITELTEATSIIGTDILPIVNGGITKKVNADTLALFVNDFANNKFFALSGGTVSGSISASGVISASASNIKINIVNDSANRIFTDADNNRVVHIDTTTAPLCAIFPSSLSNGFNVAIMNTGTNNLVLSAAQLNSAGTLITTRYGGAFVYKDSGSLFAVGRLV